MANGFAPDWKAPAALSLLVAAVFAAAWSLGFGFPSGNNLYHLPLVLDYAGSVEGPHDAFHLSLQHFVSFFWSGVSLVATENNVRMLFLVLWLATNLATALAAYAATRAGGAHREFAVVGLGLVCFGFSARGIYEFGGGELLAHSLTHSQVATALALLAAALAVRRQWVVAGAACGVTADVNLFLGFWTVVALVTGALLLARAERRPSRAREWIGMAVACGVASVPALLWAVKSGGASVRLDFSYVDFLNDFHPYHFFVHREIWLFAALVGLILVVTDVVRASRPDANLRALAAVALLNWRNRLSSSMPNARAAGKMYCW